MSPLPQQFTHKTGLLASLCVLIWAGQSVAIKVALTGLPPLTSIAIRFAIALPILCFVARLQGVSLAPERAEWRLLLTNGGLLCSQIAFFTFGTSLTTSIRAIVLIHTFPFFAAVAAHLFLPNHRLRPRLICGLGIAFFGIPTLVWTADPLSVFDFHRGDLLVLAAAVIMGGKIIFMKRTLESIQAIKLTFWDICLAVCLFGTLALLFDHSSAIEIGTPVILAMLYQGVIVSAVGFLLWLSLLKRHSANVLNVFRLFTPPFGVLFGVWILKEQVSSTVCFSILLIFIGVYLVQQPGRTQQSVTEGKTS